MKNWLNKLLFVVLILFTFSLVFGVHYYFKTYLPQKRYEENLKKGFIVVKTFNCPKDHSIKAHLGSMIYHLPGDPYYNRTNAANGYCFDNTTHAKQQGFRNSYNR